MSDFAKSGKAEQMVASALSGAGRAALPTDGGLGSHPTDERRSPSPTKGVLAFSIASVHPSRRRQISPSRAEHFLHALGINGRQYGRFSCCTLAEDCEWNKVSERDWLDQLLVDIEAIRAS